MNNYTVEWCIDIQADSPEEAARKALAIQRDPHSLATVFDVFLEETDGYERVDLSALDQGEGHAS